MFELEKQQYDRDGFVVVRQFLDSSELAELQNQLDRYIRDVVPTLSDSEAFYEDRSRPETLKQMQRMGVDSYFHDYVSSRPNWNELAAALVGEEVYAEQPQWFNKPPGTRHVTPPHQDNFYFSLAPANVLTMWLALDKVDAENGCLRYLAGSHQGGFRPHARSRVLGFSQGITNFSADDFMSEVAVPMEPGDLVVHHGMTVHRADANMSTTRHRRSFALVFKGISCQRDQEAYDRYLQAAKAQHQEQGLKV
ncbi:MAG: phytanoyl-CoA dioxygenase family protein [Planctomycetaceae bacterium]